MKMDFAIGNIHNRYKIPLDIYKKYIRIISLVYF